MIFSSLKQSDRTPVPAWNLRGLFIHAVCVFIPFFNTCFHLVLSSSVCSSLAAWGCQLSSVQGLVLGWCCVENPSSLRIWLNRHLLEHYYCFSKKSGDLRALTGQRAGGGGDGRSSRDEKRGAGMAERRASGHRSNMLKGLNLPGHSNKQAQFYF